MHKFWKNILFNTPIFNTQTLHTNNLLFYFFYFRADLFVHAIPVSGFGLTATVAGTYYLHHGQEIWINGNVTNFCSKTVYEDFSCSDSLDPTYTPVDHLQYFDCDMSTCYFVESGGDVNFASNPITGSPTGIVPQPPSKIELLFDLLESGGFSWVLPLLG